MRNGFIRSQAVGRVCMGKGGRRDRTSRVVSLPRRLRQTVAASLLIVCSLVTMFAGLVVPTTPAASQETASTGLVQMREGIDVKAAEVARLSKSEFKAAGETFTQAANELTMLVNRHADCRGSVRATGSDTQTQTGSLLECAAEHARGNGKVLGDLHDSGIEIANGLDNVASEFRKLRRETDVDIEEKRALIAEIETNLQSLEIEGRAIGEWLRANPSTDDADRLLNMRDVFARTQHLRARAASMERRIAAQAEAGHRFNTIETEIQLEAKQIRQMSNEFSYMGQAQRDYADEVIETRNLNAALTQNRGLASTTRALQNSFINVKSILEKVDKVRPNPILMPTPPLRNVQDRIFRDEEILKYFESLTHNDGEYEE